MTETMFIPFIMACYFADANCPKEGIRIEGPLRETMELCMAEEPVANQVALTLGFIVKSFGCEKVTSEVEA